MFSNWAKNHHIKGQDKTLVGKKAYLNTLRVEPPNSDTASQNVYQVGIQEAKKRVTDKSNIKLLSSPNSTTSRKELEN